MISSVRGITTRLISPLPTIHLFETLSCLMNPGKAPAIQVYLSIKSLRSMRGTGDVS